MTRSYVTKIFKRENKEVLKTTKLQNKNYLDKTIYLLKRSLSCNIGIIRLKVKKSSTSEGKYYIMELPNAISDLSPQNLSLKNFLYFFLKKTALKKFLKFSQKKLF